MSSLGKITSTDYVRYVNIYLYVLICVLYTNSISGKVSQK